MKYAYQDISFRKDTLALIATLNAIIDRYTAQGYRLSVRQLYYQLVAADLIENTERSYKRIASVINDGRLAGLIDWDSIEDRNRDIVLRTRWNSVAQIMRAAADSFHMDMWGNQQCRVFVIVEKAALAGILEPVCRKYDVPLLAARGYPSVSIVRELVLEHFSQPASAGQFIKVFHMGDHDPSGLDMTRDLRERMDMFLGDDAGMLTVDRLALNMPQIDELRPPPNPAKTTDARFDGYRRKFGEQSWELDALKPEYIANLADSSISAEIDWDAWAESAAKIETRRKLIVKAAEGVGA